MDLQWTHGDTQIVATAALSGMACALPGNWLVLRRQSMMGDALSHTALPGVVLAFLLTWSLRSAGWLGSESFDMVLVSAMYAGAIVVGVLTALLTEWVRGLGRVEAGAALGVVYTSLFAVGLLLVRLLATDTHLDLDCVLFGRLETVPLSGIGRALPRAAWVAAVALAVNLALMLLVFKELRLSAFDPALATTLGINARVMHYGLMTITAGTIIAVFESVGSILVIAMLITPAATASLVTRRLWAMVALSLVVAALSAVLGHVAALTVPALAMRAIGGPPVESAGTAGMIAVAGGGLFLLAMVLAPGEGVLPRQFDRLRLRIRIETEDLLGWLYRQEEAGAPVPATGEPAGQDDSPASRVLGWLGRRRAHAAGLVMQQGESLQLTEAGREAARGVVRSHRLWESYMAAHFPLPGDHLHETAARVEHYLGPELREQLSRELELPREDPHGRPIPGEEPPAADSN